MGSKLLYKLVGLLLGMASSVLAGALFKQMWKQVSDKEGPPKAGESDYGWKELLAGAAIQGAVFGLVKAAVDRCGARAFEKVTASWPATGRAGLDSPRHPARA